MLHVVYAAQRIQEPRKSQNPGVVVGAHHQKMNRSLIERERRSNMRNLLFRLFSLLPPQSSRMSIPDMVELATLYIKNFQRHLEELRQRRIKLGEANRATRDTRITPVLNITESNSSMEVNLITGSDMKISLSDIISIIEEEGAQVQSATCNNAGNIHILSIYCQAAVYSRDGIESSRLLQRLRIMIEE